MFKSRHFTKPLIRLASVRRLLSSTIAFVLHPACNKSSYSLTDPLALQTSTNTMKELQDWLKKQFDDHFVEPNSSLGQAISYMLNHWNKLTLFLRKAGAPLDNNVCERALKKAILHRKNALFFKTQNGARVGDLYMSLIYTCELCEANPFDYLTELQRNADEVDAHPELWMPWNYRQTLDPTHAAA